MSSSSSAQSRQEITEAIYRYCRSLDRMDRELMATVFHPEGTVRYPKFEGSWTQFVDWVWGLHSALESHTHQISNVIVLVDPEGTTATSESYVTATLWHAAGDLPTTKMTDAPDGAAGALAQTTGTLTGVWARYLDSWSVRRGRWGIDRRQCVVDMKTELAGVGLLGAGRRDRDDPSYALLDRLAAERGFAGTGVS